MSDKAKSYLIPATDGTIRFVTDADLLTESDAQAFMSRLITQYNNATEKARELVNELILQTIGMNESTLDTNTANWPEGTFEQLTEIVDTLNKTPLIVKDFFTKSLLEIMGIELGEKFTFPFSSKPETKIIQFPESKIILPK